MTEADASGLTLEDLHRESERFGVAEEQVRRDHLISHMLAAIAERCPDEVIFFGGTALSRTHLTHAHVSEAEAEKIAEQLVVVGFFEPRFGDYWVPFIYRPALEMVQGSAEGVAAAADEE